MKVKFVVASLGIFLGLGEASFACDEHSKDQAKTDISHQSKITSQIVEFEKGKNGLSEDAKKNLKTLIQSIQISGRQSKIGEIHIAAWADEQLSAKGQTELSKAARDLAEQRLTVLREFVRSETKDLSSADIRTYSMAEKNNYLARNMSAMEAAKSETELNSTFSRAGAPQNLGREEMEIFAKDGGPGKAVALIKRVGQGRQPTLENAKQN